MKSGKVDRAVAGLALTGAVATPGRVGAVSSPAAAQTEVQQAQAPAPSPASGPGPDAGDGRASSPAAPAGAEHGQLSLTGHRLGLGLLLPRHRNHPETRQQPSALREIGFASWRTRDR